jgi:hypothetical protein
MSYLPLSLHTFGIQRWLELHQALFIFLSMLSNIILALDNLET